jgi:hypothetical protein
VGPSQTFAGKTRPTDNRFDAGKQDSKKKAFDRLFQIRLTPRFLQFNLR